MKNRLSCLCLVLSLCVFADGRAPQKTLAYPEPQAFKPNNQTAGGSEIPNVFRPVRDFFRRLFGKKRRVIEFNPNVDNLTLNKTEVFAACSSAQENNICFGENHLIEVLVTASYGDFPADEYITYIYTISAGKIIGTGKKVTWDLSGVKPGTYTITAGADDGCGVCGRTETKEVKVIECRNCN